VPGRAGAEGSGAEGSASLVISRRAGALLLAGSGPDVQAALPEAVEPAAGVGSNRGGAVRAVYADAASPPVRTALVSLARIIIIAIGFGCRGY
jgi:hypothetical protein